MPRRRRPRSASPATPRRRRRVAAPAAAPSPAPAPAAQPLVTTTPVDRRRRAVQVLLPNDLNAPTQANRYVTHIKALMEYTHKKNYSSNHKFHEE